MNTGKLTFFNAKTSTADLIKALTELYGAKDSLRLEWENFHIPTDGDNNVQLTNIHKSLVSETGINYEVALWESFSYEAELANREALSNQFAISKQMSQFTDGELEFRHVSVREKDLDQKSGWPNDDAIIWLFYGDES